MANLMDYLDWRGDLTLEISPFNEVDALILAELSFVDFDGIVPPPELGRGLPLNEAAEAFFARHGGKDVPMGVLVPDTISKMLRKLMTSPRFHNMTLNGYTALLDDSIEQQFAALTIDLGNGSIYISFRGTDDTIVGWKEDLNMGFLEEIPSQKQAVEYVARVARQYGDKTIRIGGHSKGGTSPFTARPRAAARSKSVSSPSIITTAPASPGTSARRRATSASQTASIPSCRRRLSSAC